MTDSHEPGSWHSAGGREARLLEAWRNGEALADLLGDAAVGTEADVLCDFARRLGVPFESSLRGRTVPAGFVSQVSIAFARRHCVVAVEEPGDGMAVATCSPLGSRPLDDIGKALRVAIRPVLAPRAEIIELLEAAYGDAARAEGQVSDDLNGLAHLARGNGDALATENLLDLAHKPALVRLVDRLFLQALDSRASDVHFRPSRDDLRVRFRIDGVLHDVLRLPRGLQSAVVSRIKVMGRMDIAEKRLAQDGRATATIGEKEVDLRIASLPTARGEQVVVRLLDRGRGLLSLDELGMGPETARCFRELISSSHGILLVTGPTGSGKTTTLYAALRELDATEKHVLTLEDPIEYQLEGISQTQVNYKKGLTFASGLRSVLRQDPDVIMVGEIRDLETARMAVQSALTGHLVFSTLHTNDSVSAATRLLELGIEPYLVSSSVIGVLAQRLVRRICSDCKAEVELSPDVAKRAGLSAPPGLLWAGRGCDECLGTGYRSRIGIFELLAIDETVREAIMARQRASSMREAFVAQGLQTLRMDGVGKALRGVTTLEEVVRVTQRDEV